LSAKNSRNAPSKYEKTQKHLFQDAHVKHIA
jgi:hypothetical protein